ncbi:hypothetical protein LAZ67_6002991 [Cordylochernes scorpioides]|uniref:Craniofacial development protein 2-like n=1 Tax=Cordylochernes scorpioides TaxID=51811 RepID=A0ABY6KNC3_9ARAC|nr:hypothetical protein LAZ67_6002991 [Cordylochernes scorpioides]
MSNQQHEAKLCHPGSLLRYGSRPISVKCNTGHAGVDNQALREEYANVKRYRTLLKIGTWNVRGMRQIGKLQIIERSMTGINLQERERSVGFIVHKEICDAFLGYDTISDRIITLRMKATPYMHQHQHHRKINDEFSNALDGSIESMPAIEILCVLEYFNAKVGDGGDIVREELRVIGRWGWERETKKKQRLIDFCLGKDLWISKTAFQHHKRRI